MAARLAQLGATPACALGYGDDGSLNGGVFADLDSENCLLFLSRVRATDLS